MKEWKKQAQEKKRDLQVCDEQPEQKKSPMARRKPVSNLNTHKTARTQK